MTCGIYAIVNKLNGKRYVGKSVNIENRWYNHLRLLRLEQKSKDCNRYLYLSFKKYGEENFGFEYLEECERDEKLLSQREEYWINSLKTTDRNFGYNLRLDSSTKCIVHEETRNLIHEQVKGEKNPNFGNRWSEEQKKEASRKAKNLHAAGVYSSEETRKKRSEASKRKWIENPELRKTVGEKVSLLKTQYCIVQKTKDGQLIKVWDSMSDVIMANPDYFRIAIYNCCNGYKKSYRGYTWEKLRKI